MEQPELHEEILDWVGEEFEDILANSEQAIYVYVCDKHKLCNEKFSSLLGYENPEDWSSAEDVLGDVKEEDQQVLVSAYQKAMEKRAGSNINISWKNKSGEMIKTNVILVPISYKNELFALHFVTKV